MALSPDGRYVIYALREDEKQSLWVRQVATRSDVQVLAAEVANYRGLSFTPDGNYVYFVRNDAESNTYSSAYSMPVLGGTPRQLLRDVDTAVTFSPDGKRLAFVRGVPETGKARLVIANVDGTGEQTLWDVDAEINIRGILAPDWSPDGRSIAMSSGIRGVGRVTIVNVADKTTQTLYRHRGNIGRPRWTPDGTGLLVPLDTLIADRAQIWHIAYPDGCGQPLHQRPDRLQPFPLRSHGGWQDAGDRLGVAGLQSRGGRSRERLVPSAHHRRSGRRTPDDDVGRRAARCSTTLGQNIFRRDLQESMPRQLTTEGTVNLNPSACGDGSLVYQTFTRRPHRDLENGRGRIESAHHRRRRQSRQPGVFAGQHVDRLRASPRRSATGCGSRADWRRRSHRAHREPVSRQRAHLTRRFPGPVHRLGHGIEWHIGARRSRNRRPGSLHLEASCQRPANPRWSPDGKSLQYLLSRGGAGNIWEQPLTGGPPRQVTSFTDRQSLAFAWSRDGKQLAVLRGLDAFDIVLMSNFN